MILSNGNLSKNRTSSQGRREKRSQTFLTTSEIGVFSLMFHSEKAASKNKLLGLLSLERK